MSNPLYLLIAAQTYFLVLGKTRLEFNITWTDVVVAVLTAIVAELAFFYIERRMQKQSFKLFFPASAVAAALGLALFFRASNPLYFAAAALAAIGSKYLIRVKGKHIFNPSNFAVVAMVFLFPSAATIELTQWGNSVPVYLLVAAICFYIAYRAGALFTTLSFLGSYTVLLLLSVFYHIDILAVHHYGLIGPSLVLFASFMITDPRTAPVGFYPRILHGASVAAGFFLLEILGIKYALFVASFLTAFLGVFSAYGMQWINEKKHTTLPKNLLTCLLLVGCMGYFYTRTIQHTGVFVDIKSVSWSFLFMGVESPSIAQCSRNPLFVPDPKLGITTPSMTTGAAWGDFDRDGREDLFVSTIDVPSRLYRNTPQGFVDVTAKVGLPTFNSQSAFFADYDNDGQRDLFVVYGMQDYIAAAEGQPILTKPPATTLRVFRNTGGQFVEKTKELGLADFMLPPSAGTLSFADYNNDGYLDFVYAERSTYHDITSKDSRALLKSFFEPYLDEAQTLVCTPKIVKDILRRYGKVALPDTAAQEAFADSGGCMIVVSAIPLREQTLADAKSDFEGLSVQVMYRAGSVHLFENKYGGSFVEHPQFAQQMQAIFASTTEQHFLDGEHPYNDISGTFYQPVSFDYDRDGKMDIYLSIDWGTNLLLRNEGQFRFADVTAATGMNYSGNGMGADVSDYDGDGTLDVLAGNVRRISLYKNNGDETFTNEDRRFNLNRLGISWGLNFLDYDLDGWDDIFVGNGGVEVISNVPTLDLSRPLFRSDKLYKNIGGNNFVDATADAFCPQDGQLTRPVAVADYDNDGDPDLFAGYFAYGVARTPPTLYQNQATSSHYIAVELQGTISTAEAAGATVSVTSGGRTQTKIVLLGNSFYAESSHRLLFGLGTDSTPVDITVRWPSGMHTSLQNVDTDRLLTVVEPRR